MRSGKAFLDAPGSVVVSIWSRSRRAKLERAERKKVLALAQARKVDVILVTELTRWGRSMLDLFHTLQDLQAWGVSLVAQTGLQFDLRSAQGKLIASLMAALAEFERDLLRQRERLCYSPDGVTHVHRDAARTEASLGRCALSLGPKRLRQHSRCSR